MRIGVLTAGGDCPGLNAAIRAVVARATGSGAEVVGFENGWAGLIEARFRRLSRDDVRGILVRGGTILGTSRIDPYVHDAGAAAVREGLAAAGVDGIVVIGGDGTLRTAARLHSEGLAVVGVPKTIDNDVGATDVSFGFHTAVQIVTDAIDRLTTTAEAHNRIMVVEVMGRTAGWIAAYAGLAGGAEAILVPEVPFDLDDLAVRLQDRHQAGHTYSVVVVAEGITLPDGQQVTSGVDAYGFERLGGAGQLVAARLEAATGFEARTMVLGHLQRGGTPTAFDRVLATRMGLAAADAVLGGRSGVMVAVRGDEIVEVDLADACRQVRTMPSGRLFDAAWFFA